MSFGVSLKFLKNIFVIIFLKFFHYFFMLLPFQIFILYLFNVVDVFEYSKFVVLNYDVFLRSDFYHIQMCEIQLSYYHGGVGCVCQLKCIGDQNRYVWTTFQTIEFGWDLDFFVGSNLFKFYAKCHTKKTWWNDFPFFWVQN